MAKPIILGVRHGRTELNSGSNSRLRAWENPPLDKRGILDAKIAGQMLKRYEPKIIYSSDLSRDLQTAQIISGELGNIPFEVDFGLRTADMGDLAGMFDEDVTPLVRKWYENPWWEAPSGESNNNFLSRFYPAFDVKFNLAKGSEAFCPMVVITHGRNLAALHARSEMIPQIEAQMPFPGGIASLYLDDTGEQKLEFLGDTEDVFTDA